MKNLSALVAALVTMSCASVVLAADTSSAGYPTTLPGVSETQSSQGVEPIMPAAVYKKTHKNWGGSQNWNGSQTQTTSPGSGGVTGTGAGGQTDTGYPDTGSPRESVPPIPMDQN